MRSIGPWAVRVAWFLLPVLAGPAFGDALDSASRPVQLVGSLGLWAGWAAVLVATLVPRASSLTIVRTAAPASLVAAIAAAVDGPRGVDDAVALAAAAVAVVAAAWAGTTDTFVNGSSYGDERRFALRSPPAALLAAAPVAWLLAVAVPASAVLLLAAQVWVPGAVLAVLGVAGVRIGGPALHRLSRRWLVLVPAGLVVHDHAALADPVLLRRASLTRVGPAPATVDDSVDRLDLTLGAGGLLVELALREPAELPVARGQGRRREVVATMTDRVLVAPARPGAFLAAAADRRIPVA